MDLFFEDHSIASVLTALSQIRRARRIWFYIPIFPNKDSASEFKKKLVQKMINIINPAIEVAIVPIEERMRYAWQANRDSMDITNTKDALIRSSSIYRTFRSFLDSDDLAKMFKGGLVLHVARKLLYYRLARMMMDRGDQITLVPEDRDEWQIQDLVFGNCEKVNKHIVCPLNLLSSYRKMIKMLILLAFPLYFIMKKGIAFIPAKRINVDVIMPINWGISEGGFVGGVRRDLDNRFICGGVIPNHRIALYLDAWRYGKEREKEYERIIKNDGIQFFDVNRLRITPAGIRFILRIWGKMLYCSFKYVGYKRDNITLIHTGIKALKQMLDEYITISNVIYKVSVIFNDYDPGHVVRTIMNNQFNRKTIAIQHSAAGGSYVLPMLGFVHLNKYCIYGNGYKQEYYPYWEEIKLDHVGHYKIDPLIQLLNNPTKMKALRDRFQRKYKARRIVLFTVPNPSCNHEINVKEKWASISRALIEFRSTSCDLNIIVRPRERGHLLELGESLIGDPRISVEMDDFSTYELIAMADACIVSTLSSVAIEAASAGKLVFAYDFTGCAKLFYGNKYGSDFILDKHSDLLRAFKAIADRSALDNHSDRLALDFNYYRDGKCVERMRDIILGCV